MSGEFRPEQNQSIESTDDPALAQRFGLTAFDRKTGLYTAPKTPDAGQRDGEDVQEQRRLDADAEGKRQQAEQDRLDEEAKRAAGQAPAAPRTEQGKRAAEAGAKDAQPEQDGDDDGKSTAKKSTAAKK